jgi:hypothetical protein
MRNNTIISGAILALLASWLAGCAGELQAERVDGSTSIRLKWQSRPAEMGGDATTAPPGEGEPSKTGKG